ncbi:MAG: DUF5666 domain-containing protein [Acidobacteriia bacterium]|nr:DUF5666 domain-containing protein [Terriglobia bacterium]
MSWKTACCFLLAVAVQAQSPMPVGIVRGKLVSSIGTNRAGEITVRGADGLASCNYDARTYFEREFEMIHANALAPGDPVEVLADRRPGSTACYARTVQVTNRRPQLYVPGVRPPLRTAPSPTEAFAPRGDFMFGGRVVSREPRQLTVMTHAGEIHLVLRPDTRYAGDGLSADASSLKVNTHVFVRAGRDVDGFLEAYQIMWGEMTGPQ